MIIDSKVENKKIANQYKELLRISYQTLVDSDIAEIHENIISGIEKKFHTKLRD